MGTHIYAVAQRRVDGKWRHLLNCPVAPCKPYWYGNTHYAFLSNGCTWPSEDDLNFTISKARGYPTDYDPYQSGVVEFFDPDIRANVEDIELPDESLYNQSWLSLDELINHDYDRSVTRFGETKSLREFLGDEFIAFWKDIQQRGAERIVFGFD